MIASGHFSLARAWSASVAASALMLVVASGADAQSARPEKGAAPAASTKVAKKKTKVPALSTAAAPAPYAMVTKEPPLLVTPAWTGLYAGMSFGPASIRANTVSAFHTVGTSNTRTTTQDVVDVAGGSRWGPLSDIYLGYNFRLGGNLVGGVQAEGTVTNAATGLDGVVTAVDQTKNPPPAGSSLIFIKVFQDSLAERWALSALGRLGVLLTPRDLAYMIGGYTYGGFEWNGRTFSPNGATVGAGWEHAIAPAWAFKAEYRFTVFEAKDLPRPSNSTSIGASPSESVTTGTERVSGIALHALRFGITHYFDTPPRAAPAYIMPVKAPPVLATPWEGPYAGVSYGPARIAATTSTMINAPLTMVTANPNGSVSTLTETNITTGAGTGRNAGALSDVYLGYNFRLGGNVIAGVQAEGTTAEVQAAINQTQVQRTTATTVTTPPGRTTTSATLVASTFIDAIAERWAMSALGRIGVLIDPHDLVYGIGGYTYGGFDWSGRVFGLNGATAGAGWEHEIAPNWTLKAEYRYTAFQDKDLPRPIIATSTQTSVSNTGAVTTSVMNQAGTIADHVSGINLHALRFGITHYLDDVPPAPSAMPVKAPVLAGPVWTGVYGGVSFGLMSMQAKSESITNQIFNDFQASVTDVQITNNVFTTSGRHAGAVADLLAGYNAALGPKLIGGVQLEGSIVHGIVVGEGSSAATFSDTAVSTSSGRIIRTSTSTSTGSALLDVQSRWMASALARLGVLADPRDLLYAIGGWSYGGFTTGEFISGALMDGVRPFNLNGPTMGVGFEREVAPAWTLRAEYRYTHFLPRDVAFARTQAETQTASTSTVSTFLAFAENDRIAVDMHTVRFGIAHYFASR